jgi:hypothetical protein
MSAVPVTVVAVSVSQTPTGITCLANAQISITYVKVIFHLSPQLELFTRLGTPKNTICKLEEIFLRGLSH